MDIKKYIAEAKFQPRKKSEPSLFEEYEVNKWASFERFVTAGSSDLSLQEYLNTVHDWTLAQGNQNENTIPVCIDGELKVIEKRKAISKNYELLLNELHQIWSHYEFRNLVELGSGLGNNLAALYEHFPKINYFSKEYSPTARRLQKKYLLSNINNFEVDEFNLFTNNPNLNIENAVCITSFVLSLVREFPTRIIEEILNSGFKYVINVEPLFEIQDANIPLDSKIRDYIIQNDYNQDYYGKLLKYEKIGALKILNQQKNKYGINAFFPGSVLTWEICGAA